MAASPPNKWFWEFFTPDMLQGIALEGILYSGNSPYQKVEVIDTNLYGRCLVLDGKLQSAEADEFIYHEALIHPVLLAHPNPRRVLIAGGGEGATLREVLAHRTVEQAVMVDLDEEVVRVCKEHLPHHHQGAFDDPRVDLRIADARDPIMHGSETFDAIILDLPDPIEEGPAYLLYTQKFYQSVMERLAPDGVAVVQAGSALPMLLSEAFTPIFRTLSSVFPLVRSYRAEVASFGGLWGYVLASRGPDPAALTAEEIDKRIAERVQSPLRFYDGITHEGLFRLPKYLREALASETRLITEDAPLFVY
ncbi:MAG: spermidine synthase [Chloroflexi bacterium]|jgi:spermidine synthase|nr:MAG: spermidine synthase [Chloroflexota bacterium]